MLLVLSVPMTTFAADFEIDQYAATDGMSQSWYQGYEPSISYNTMTICLPIRSEANTGDITVSLALDDPNVFLLSSKPEAMTVSMKDGIYPVKLTLALERNRRNGDYPANITIKGADETGKEIVETIPYVIRIRDGWDSHETMEPVLPGETKEARLSFTPKAESVGIYSGTVTITCEDVYGNSFSQTLDVTLEVEEPVPEVELQQGEEKEKNGHRHHSAYDSLCSPDCSTCSTRRYPDQEDS